MKHNLLFLFTLLFCKVVYSQNISSEPDWLPNGKSFVYTYGKDSINLFIYSLEDNSTIKLTDLKGVNVNPAWSPSEKYIAFVSTRNGNQDLYYYDLETKKTTQLTRSTEIEATPSWWSDGQLTYIRFNPADKSRKIFKTDLQGNATEFVPEATLQTIYPKISPNKDVLVFGGKPLNSKESFHLYAKDLETNEIKQLENMPIVSYNPSWYPSGNEVAFINQSNQEVTSAAIYTYHFKSEEVSKTLECEKGCYHPRVSPDGKYILYLDGWGKESKGIYLLNLKTQETTKVR